MEEIIFAPGSVPVAVVARVYGKDASWVRAGFYCPVCRKERYITWSELRKKIVYEGEGTQK